MKRLQNSYLCLFLEWESPPFFIFFIYIYVYQQCNMHCIKSHWMPHVNSLVSFKFSVKSEFTDCSWLNNPFPFKIFLYPLHGLCWLWCILKRKSKFSWTICGLEWHMGWCRCILVFVCSSVAVSVSNSSIRGAIFMWCSDVTWLVPHETVAVLVCPVYTIQPCTMLCCFTRSQT